MKTAFTLLSILCAALLSGCGHSDSYVAEGTLSDGATINMRILAHSPAGVYTSVTASPDGKFRFEQPLKQPSLIELFDNDYRPLARFIARPGDDISIRIDRSNYYATRLDGNPDTREWWNFLNENSELLSSATPETRNRIIADYVKAHPSERTAEMLMLTEFAVDGKEVLADSLYRLIEPDVRESGFSADFALQLSHAAAGSRAEVGNLSYIKRGNTRHVFRPADSELSLLVFTAEQNGRDTIVEDLRRAARLRHDGRFDILDAALHQDTVPWSREIRNDSATWAQGWIGGGVAATGVEPLAIPVLPYFILIDSHGKQLWRGRSADKAYSEAVSRIR